MKDQINTIREALTLATDGPIVDRDGLMREALTALAQLEAMAGKQEPKFWYRPVGNDGLYEGPVHNNSIGGKMLRDEKPGEWVPLFEGAAPVAQQYEAGDVASASAQGFRDGVASVTAGQEPVAWPTLPIATGVMAYMEHPYGAMRVSKEPAYTAGQVQDYACEAVNKLKTSTENPVGEVMNLWNTERECNDGVIGNLFVDLPVGTNLYAAPVAQHSPEEPIELLWQVRSALALACAICDAVPNREPGHLGKLVNAQDDGTHGYRQIHDAEAALSAYLTTPTAAPVAQQRKTVTNDEQASAYMDARLWEFIDMAGMWPRAKPDPRIWAHVMVYAPVAQQPQADTVRWGVDWGTHGDRTCVSIIKKHADGKMEVVATEYEPERKAAPQQAEAVPPTHVMVPVEPTDEMIDAACEAVKDLYWVDFVRAYKAAIAQQKGGV